MKLNISKSLLFKSTIIYTIGTSLNKAVPFLLLPIITRYIDPEGYGYLELFKTTNAIILILITMSFTGAFTVHYFKYGKDEYLFNCILVNVTFAFIIFLFVFFFKTYFLKLFDFSAVLILIIPLNALMQLFKIYLHLTFRNEQRAFIYVVSDSLYVSLNFLLTILFLRYFNLSWQGRVIAIVLINSLFAFIALVYLLITRYIKFTINLNYIKDLISFGLPLLPHAFSAQVLFMIDRYFFKIYFHNEMLGLYSFAYRFGSLILLITSSFLMAWQPYFLKKIKQASFMTKVKLVKIIYIISIMYFLFAFLDHLLSTPIINLWFSENYQRSQKFIVWLALSFSLYGISGIFLQFLYFNKKTKLIPIISVSSLLLNIILNLLFINIFGEMGIPYATLVTAIYYFLLSFIISNKIHPMPWLKGLSFRNLV